MEKYDKPAATIVLTMLHAGGKFGGAGYKVSGGLHGVGVSVVNALSEWLELDIYVEGFHWNQRFERGDPVTELVKREKLDKDGPTGTTVSFLADPDIFEDVDYDYRVLAQRLRETAFLTKGLKISLERRARRRRERHLPVRGRHPRLRGLHQPREGRHPPQHHLPRERDQPTAP